MGLATAASFHDRFSILKADRVLDGRGGYELAFITAAQNVRGRYIGNIPINEFFLANQTRAHQFCEVLIDARWSGVITGEDRILFQKDESVWDILSITLQDYTYLLICRNALDDALIS